MKIKFYIGIIALLALSLFPTSADSKPLKFNLSFDIDKLSVKQMVEDGKAYSVVTYEGLMNEGEIGRPSLPVKYCKAIVPTTAEKIRISWSASDENAIEISDCVIPQQDFNEGTNKGEEEHIFEHINPELYFKDDAYPLRTASYASDGFLFCENHLVTICVSPVTYLPQKGLLRFHKNIEVTLEFDDMKSDASGWSDLLKFKGSSKTLRARERESNFVRSLVVNPQDIGHCIPEDTLLMTLPNSPHSLPAYEYCVIAPRSLAPAFERLISWKKQKGYSAGVVCLEDILNHSFYNQGDIISTNITDSAGCIRSYIYEANLRVGQMFVLLAGDHTNMPLRYATHYKDNQLYPIPTDYYFADMENDWNADNDGLYGKKEHIIDWEADVLVGRLLCRTKEEVGNFTQKLLKYEINPGNGDYSYLGKALSTLADEYTMSLYYDLYIISQRMDNIFDLRFIDQRNEFKTGADIINLMNNTHYGFTSFHGHGNPAGVEISTVNGQKHGILAREGFWNFHIPESGNGIDNLHNGDFPQVSYSQSCLVNCFDVFSESGGYQYNDENVPCVLGRSFTSYGKYGGPAFFGSTREIYLKYNSSIEAKFLDAMINGVSNAGLLEYESKSHPDINIEKYTASCLMHSLVGDPEFDIWLGAPSDFTSTCVTYGNGIVNVLSSDLPEYDVTFCDCNGQVRRMHSSSSSLSFIDNRPNTVATVFGGNKVPYLTTPYFQNETVTNNCHFFVENAFLGRNVSTNKTQGNFIVSDAELCIEAKGNVFLCDGFYANSGAELDLKSKNNVSISGVSCESGSNIHICSPKIDIETNFNADKGTIINFDKYEQ